MNVYTPASDRIVHHTYADFTDRLVPRPIHLVQYDMSLPIIAVTLYNDGQTYELPADVEVNIRWHKRDNNIVYNPALGCNDRRNIVYFEISKQMTILEGITEPVVEIMINGSQVANSGSFKVIVDRNPVTSEELASASEAKALYEFVEMAETAAFHAKESADSASASEGNAMASAASALTSETRSKASEDNAALSEVNAKTSETNAAASEAIAKTAETNAVAAATTVMNMADESEAWAVGTKGGVPVAPTDPQSGNSAKDWAMAAQAAAHVGPATPTVPGLVKPDNVTITVDPDGTIHGQAKVDIATITQVGVMKPDGNTTWVDPDGTLHAKGGGGGQGGSVVKIVTREASFEGLDVVVTNGVESVTGKIVGGVCEVNTTQTGTYTATITESGDTYVNSVNIPYFGVYEIEINKFSAEITVNLNGGVTVDVQAEVTATHTDGSAFKYTISSSGKIRVGKTGAYTIQAKIDGMPSTTANVSIADETPKNVTVKFAKLTVDVECETSANLTVTNGTEVFSIVATSDKTVSKYVALGTWVVSGDIDGTDVSASVEITDYVEKSVTVKGKKAGGFELWVKSRFPSSTATSIDELDEKQIRELMTVHDSVDILVDWLKDDEEAALEILSYDLCAKWINLRDYAFDKLSENEAIKAVMDKTAVNLVGQVPIMTANDKPYGNVNQSSYFTYSGKSYLGFYAFDGVKVDTDKWVSNAVSNQWLEYKFENPIIVNAVTFMTDISRHAKNCIIKGSNDGDFTTVGHYEDIYSFVAEKVETEQTVKFSNDKPYLYYRFHIVDVYSGDTNPALISLQFYADEYDTKYSYGEWALVGQVPKMTSNTAPYGEASASSEHNTNYAAYKAFDGDDSTYWQGTASDTNACLKYSFTNPICLKKVFIKLGTTNGTVIVKVKNENGQEIPISDSYTMLAKEEKAIDINNNNYYTEYSVYVSGTGYQNIARLQFYAWQPKGNVPIMTANNAPYGTVGRSSVYSTSYEAWQAFDGKDNTSWASADGGGAYIEYKFVNPINVKKIGYVLSTESLSFKSAECEIQYSNDGSIYTSVNSFTLPTTDTATIRYVKTNSDVYALYWRINIKSANVGNHCALSTLQFYGRELKVSVPKMDGNNSPWGEAKAGSTYSDFYVWKAFDGNDTYPSAWCGNHATSATNTDITDSIQYKFTKETCVKKLYIFARSDSNAISITKIVASVSNTGKDDDWTVVDTKNNLNISKGFVDINNVNSGLYFKIDVSESKTTPNSYPMPVVGTLQFYGFDYSQREFDLGSDGLPIRKYIYDHGVELEEIVAYKNMASTNKFEKLDYQMLVTATDGRVGIITQNTVEISKYDRMRQKLGDRWYTSNASNPGGMFVMNASGGAILVVGYTKEQLPYDVCLDISSQMTDEYAFSGADNGSTYNSEFTITEWWLEK